MSSKKREPVSHSLIFMLSEELQNFKPYAVPVWVVKYQSLTDKKMRELNEEIRLAMEDIGMVSVGKNIHSNNPTIDYLRWDYQIDVPPISYIELVCQTCFLIVTKWINSFYTAALHL